MIKIARNTKKEKIIEIASKCHVSDNCKKCRECCKKGSGYVLDEEMPELAKFLGVDEKKLKPDYLDETELFGNVIHKMKLKKYPFGECVFLANDGCGVQGAKPLYCKAGTWDKETSQQCHDWFVLNCLIKSPESIRQWASYLKFNKTIPGGELNEIVKSPEELKKILNREV